MSILPTPFKRSIHLRLIHLRIYPLIFSFLMSSADVLAGIISQSIPPNLDIIKGQAQGTTYLIKYHRGMNPVNKSQIDSILTDLDLSLSLYRPDSRVSQFNNARFSYPADAHLTVVLSTALHLQRISNGAFDIRLYKLSRAWGFGPEPAKRPPSKRKIIKLKPAPSDSIWLDGNLVRKSNPKVRIDLDGIAQGYSVDVLANFLEQKGIHHYMVELGGEIRTSGFRSEETPWRIGIESPQTDEKVVSMTVDPGNGALTTSGSYRKTRKFGDRIYSHVIDPRIGRPIENGMLSCTIWAQTAMLADAMDNAAMVLGPALTMKLLKDCPGVEGFFVWRDPQGIIHTDGTPGFFRKVLPPDSDHS